MNAQVRARTNELMLMAVAATTVMLFAAFSSAYLIRRTASDWNPVAYPPVIWFITALLAASSVTLELARRRGQAWMTATIALGLAFLAGQILAWRTLAQDGVFLATSPHASFLYLLSAVHGIHLLGGLIALMYAAVHRPAFPWCRTYWHFVGGLWLYLVVLLRVA